LTVTSKLSSNNPSYGPEQRVFGNPSLEGAARTFSSYICDAIKRVTIENELKAAVTIVFPAWGGAFDCLMSLEIDKDWCVEWLIMALFKAKVQWVNQVRRIILSDGVTLIIPTSELTLRGVQDKAIVEVFGHEICDAIAESPVRKDELARGVHATECVSMILTKIGAIINLALSLDGGVKIQNKLYT